MQRLTLLVVLLFSGLLTGCEFSSSDHVDRNIVIAATAADIQNCQAGTLTQAAKDKAIEVFNDIRAKHGLEPVTYDTASDQEVMAAALVMAANQDLDHQPPSHWRCYSETAFDGASTSNIGLYVSSDTSQSGINYYENNSIENNFIGYLTDVNNVYQDDVGHRRWLLNPFLEKIAYGQVGGIVNGKYVSSSAIKVVYDAYKPKEYKQNEIIAYPIGDYPVKYYENGAILSVAILWDESEYIHNHFVDYSNTSVTVTNQQTGEKRTIASRNIAFDEVKQDGFFSVVGLPNHLQFKYGNLEVGTRYRVDLLNVDVCTQVTWIPQGGYSIPQCLAANYARRSYWYEFKLIP